MSQQSYTQDRRKQDVFSRYDLKYNFDQKCQIRLLKLEYDAYGQPWGFLAPPAPLGKNIQAGAPRRFTALSYEWGDDLRQPKTQQEPKPFYIDGQIFSIRDNLLHLLKAIPKHQEQRNIPNEFWIDAISIDQDNREEKRYQIELLNQIYSSATCVLSWLGPGQDFSDKALEYINDPRGKEGGAVDDLLNRRYWSRLWMVQEVVLGKQWLVCHCTYAHYVRLRLTSC
jgi:hypothetical protein